MVALALNSVPHLLKVQALPAVSVAFYSDAKKTVLPSSLKKGTGGRSSFNGVVATVFGATGFLGPYVCNKLGKQGTQLILPHRCDFYWARPLRLVGDLGQVLFHEFHLKDEESIYNAVKYSNVVVNLVGQEYETKNFTFEQVHVDGARRLARIAKEAGVERFIHVSTLNAAEDPPKAFLKKGSDFLKTKYRGELAVREEFPNATIIRPAIMYGQEDRFFMHYTMLMRRTGRWVALWKKGEETIKQLVHVEDVAQGIANAVTDPSTAGKTYQAVGPKRYYLSDIMDWAHVHMRKDPKDWGYKRIDLRFDPTCWIRMFLFDKFPGSPIAHLTFDKVERDSITDFVDKNLPTLEDLDVKLMDLEEIGPWHLKPLRAYQYYSEEVGEYPDPPPLRVAVG